MIRWSYLLPRIVLAVAVMLVAKYAVPWLMKWTAVEAIQSATGAVARVDHVWVSPLRGTVRVDGVRLARRASSRANLVEYQSAVLAVDLGALARRRTVINRAEIHGLSFGTARIERTTTDLGPWDDTGARRWSNVGSQLGRQWWQSVSSGLESRVEDQFRSVKLSRELSAAWPERFDQVEREIIRCRQTAQQFHDKLKRMPDLLRGGGGIDVLQDTRRQGAALREQIEQLRRRVAQLRTQMLDDRAALQDALAQDRAQVRAALHVVRLDDHQLCDSLLAGEIHDWLDQVRPWLEVAHWLLAHPRAAAPAERGVFIPLTGDDDARDLLVRDAALDGRIDLRGHSMPFRGQTRNLQLSLHEPATFHFQIGEDASILVEMVFQQARAGVRQSITVSARHVPMAAQTWGSTDGLALSVAPAQADITLALVVSNDQFDGTMRLAATNVRLVPVVTRGPAAKQLQDRLATALADLNSFSLTARVAGPAQHPHVDIESDIGQALQQRVGAVFQQMLAQHADQLAQQADRLIAQQCAQLQDELSRRQTDYLKELDIGYQLVTSTTKPTIAARAGWKRLLGR